MNENSSEARADRKKAAAAQTPEDQTRSARLARRSSANKAAQEQADPRPSKKDAAAAVKRDPKRDERLKADSRTSRDARRAAAGDAAEKQANPPETKKEKAAREKREADAKAAPEPQPEPQPEA